ncbi:ArnT family glycosyltransferase [Actomonas aquatica]|uniref:Glycosyltransferase family 39 protein n=1 Tax=Actomonas aquatica TaxID=2866162 RepID=A0ABZ1CAU7_9BACT|nr:glycosyltransferase family 39 protein [Opitutus sp. WL0086]WRQ88505.1 glycosyltransferase family 39 protein [Opitutus sp. WL0086]
MSVSATTPAGSPGSPRPRVQWILLLGLVCFAFGLRVSFTDRIFYNLDEGVTFTLAQQILDGDVMYRDAADHRGPLVPYLKAAALLLLGDWNIIGTRLAFNALLGLFAYGLFSLARRLGEPRTGVAAALVFSILSFTLQGPPETMALHTEWFMEAFSLLGFLVFASTHAAARKRHGVLVGICFGLAALNKQPALLDYGVVLVISLLQCFVAAGTRRQRVAYLTATAIGVVLPFIAAWAYFAANGAGDAFRWYAWTYNTSIYVPEVPFAERLQGFRLPFKLLSEHAPLLGLATAVGIIGLLVYVFSPRNLPRAGGQSLPVLPWLILGWGAAGWISCLLSGRDFPHYALHMLPAICLASGWIFARAWTLLVSPPRRSWPLRLLAGVMLCYCLVNSVQHATIVHRYVTVPASPGIIVFPPLAKAYTAPSDRVFVWGFFPEIYGWMHRLPASRFSNTNFLTGMIPWTNVAPDVDTSYAIVPGAWDQLRDDLQPDPPRLIVATSARYYTKYPLVQQSWFRDWLPDHYAEVTSVDLQVFSARAFLRLQPIAASDIETARDAQLMPAPAIRFEDGPGEDAIIRVSAELSSRLEQDVLLLVEGHPIRHLRLPATDEPDRSIAFLIPLTELHGLGSDRITLRTTAVDAPELPINIATEAEVALLLNLNRAAFGGPPVLRWGNSVLSPLASTGDWSTAMATSSPTTPEWQLNGPGSLTFPLPAAAQRLSFRWDGAGAPLLRFTAANGDDIPALPLQDETGGQFSTILPSPRPARVTLAWSPTPDAPHARVSALLVDAVGPVLHLGDQAIHAIHSEIGVGGLPSPIDAQRWFMHAPARVHYLLRPGFTGVVMRYGFTDDTWQRPPEHPTTGAEFRIEHVSAAGQREVLFSRYMNPMYLEHDRGLQTVELPLTRRSDGELQFVIDEGQFNEKSGDWTMLADGRLLGPGPDITLPDDTNLTPLHGSFGQAEIIDTRTPEGWWDAHAPSRLIYSFPTRLAAVTIRFAFKPGAYENRVEPHVTDGIELVVERLSSGGEIEQLHRSAWNPHVEPQHRRRLEVTVPLPRADPGDQLIIRSTTGPNSDPELDWTLWGPFSGALRENSTTP